jgi:hypothetical protein
LSASCRQLQAGSLRSPENPRRSGYSVRSALIGFTFVARRAGKKQAINAAPASTTLEVMSA